MSLTVMQQVVADAFTNAGLPPELGLGIAKHESNFNPNASVVTGGDAARGGSYGLCQMSLKTALSLDRAATIAKLHDPRYNAGLAAKLCLLNNVRAKGVIEDVISMYNSGKPFWCAPDSTKTVYVPNVQRYMAEFKAQLAANTAASSATPAQTP
jgi:soluble lytic murein transglycosylase-like protein